jgi:hypothetical protein
MSEPVVQKARALTLAVMAGKENLKPDLMLNIERQASCEQLDAHQVK